MRTSLLAPLLLPLAATLPNPPPSPCPAPYYLPPDATPSRAPLALLDVYTSPNCTSASGGADADAIAAGSGNAGAYTTCKLPIYDSGRCIAFMPQTQTLRVVESDKERLKYNSLRVYKKADCTGGWALEPHICQGPEDDGECACSRVPGSAYRSIQIVLE